MDSKQIAADIFARLVIDYVAQSHKRPSADVLKSLAQDAIKATNAFVEVWP